MAGDNQGDAIFSLDTSAGHVFFIYLIYAILRVSSCHFAAVKLRYYWPLLIYNQVLV